MRRCLPLVMLILSGCLESDLTEVADVNSRNALLRTSQLESRIADLEAQLEAQNDSLEAQNEALGDLVTLLEDQLASLRAKQNEIIERVNEQERAISYNR